jgi:hypothetical protein
MGAGCAGFHLLFADLLFSDWKNLIMVGFHIAK